MNTPERVETMTNNDAEYDDMPGLGMELDTDDDYADNAYAEIENNSNSSLCPANTTVVFVPGIYSTAGGIYCHTGALGPQPASAFSFS